MPPAHGENRGDAKLGEKKGNKKICGEISKLNFSRIRTYLRCLRKRDDDRVVSEKVAFDFSPLLLLRLIG